jgi:hypothetical protein
MAQITYGMEIGAIWKEYGELKGRLKNIINRKPYFVHISSTEKIIQDIIEFSHYRPL